MDNSFISEVITLFEQRKWQEIISKYYDHPVRNQLLWVFPSFENFDFLCSCLTELECKHIVSIGCGTGLLEWLIREATGICVSGIEVDGAWWNSKYAPPKFIDLVLTTSDIDNNTCSILQDPDSALLFCYFNNRPAFESYLRVFKGKILIIIGPSYGKGVHAAPMPFEFIDKEWILIKFQEVRNSGDFIVIYRKTILN